MKLSIGRCDITPLKPIHTGGYVQRVNPYEKVHDPILATVFVLTLSDANKLVWVGTDTAGGGEKEYDLIRKKLSEKGLDLPKNKFVYSGTHTHSGPLLKAFPGLETFGKEEEENLERMCSVIAECIYDTYNKEAINVHTRYSDVLIDGIYSNRNDANKLSDKHEYMIGFFDDNDTLVGVYHLMSHHCTVIGPLVNELSADLYGALRLRLEKEFNCTFLMAQGNAGDMGNRQYRDGADFAALDREADKLVDQILKKYEWNDIDIDSYKHQDVVYNASYYVDNSGYEEKYKYYSERLETATNPDDIKMLIGWKMNAERKMNEPSYLAEVAMRAEILTLGQLQIVLVPGELGSILGLRIKKASKAELCFVWGYCNGSDLGYMVEEKAFETESQESQVTTYNPGVAEKYIEEIIMNL